MRWTKSAGVALERLTTRWQGVIPKDQRGSAQKKLALAIQALRLSKIPQHDVQDAIRWHGVPKLEGLAGWMDEALRWGRSDRTAVRIGKLREAET